MGNYTFGNMFSRGHVIASCGVIGLVLLCLALPISAQVVPNTDFDRDGKSDNIVYHPSAGNWYVRYSQNGGSFIRNWGYSESWPLLADFDGDRKPDITVFDPPTGNWYVLLSATQKMSVQNWGSGTMWPVPADYDGDGRADLAVFDPASGNWYIQQSSNAKLRTRNWGYAASWPLPADYDGDGKADITVFDPPSGNWYIEQSLSKTMRTRNWGYSASWPMPADFDGDGKTDITVFDPPSGNWYILQSQSGIMRLQNWALTGAVPCPAYVDGDSKADIRIYQPSSGYWFASGSINQQLSAIYYGWPEAIPVGNAYRKVYRPAAIAPNNPPPGNPPPPASQDELNISNVKLLGTHKTKVPANAPITRKLHSANIEGSNVKLSYETLNWPDNNSGIGSDIDGRVYIFWMEGSTVTGGHFEWKRPGQTSKGLSNINNGYLEGKKPARGATVWFCLMSNAADQRTNVVKSDTPYP